MRFPNFLRKQHSCVTAGEPLRFPLPFTGRIALLDATLPTEANVRRFDPADLRPMRDFKPEALVAPLGVALTLADQKIRGLLDLTSVTVANVVLTSVSDAPLADHHRDLLWKAFGVPVFEQLCDYDGTVIARECEVHDGLHVSPERANEFGDAVTWEHCECGSETPRLVYQWNNLSALRPRIFSRSTEAA